LFGGSTSAWARFDEEYAQHSPKVAELAQLEAQKQLQAGGVRSVPQGITGAAAGGRGEAFNRRHKLFNRHAPGAAADHLLGELGEYPLGGFFSAIRPNVNGDIAWSRIQNAALSERVGAEGGFLVPEQLRSEILIAALEKSIVRQRARVIPMDSLRMPIPMIDDTSHTSSVLGGVVSGFVEEGAAMTASAPAFGRIVLEAKKLYAYTTVPNELLQDAYGVGLEEWLLGTLPAAIAFTEDLHFIGANGNGTGVGEPQGVLSAPGAVKVSRSGGANTIVFNDIVSMRARMLPVAAANAVWVASPDAIPELTQMYLAAGGSPGVAPPLWLMDFSAAGDLPETLLGRPIFFTEKAAALGSLGDLMLVNWDYYLVGDRMSLQAAVSHEYLFANDLVAYRLIERIDGRAWLQSPITQASNSTRTLSPYILLN
jgi:HK97 family phage major capsid protein